MHIKRIHEMIERLAECALCELQVGTEQVCTEEFGAVVDMIKDLSEAEYRARISKAMEEAELKDDVEEIFNRRYYDDYRLPNGRFAKKGTKGARYMPIRGYEEPRMLPDIYREHSPEYRRDVDRDMGRMYYTESNMTKAYDKHSGKSSMSRAEYIKAKEERAGGSADDKSVRVSKLGEYMDDINDDLKELINGMMPEEKAMLKQKITKLGALI